MKTIYAFFIMILPIVGQTQSLEETVENYFSLIVEGDYESMIDMNYLVKMDPSSKEMMMDMSDFSEDGIEMVVEDAWRLFTSPIIEEGERSFAKAKGKVISTIIFSDTLSQDRISEELEYYKMGIPNLNYDPETRKATYKTYTQLLFIKEDGKWFYADEQLYNLGMLDGILSEKTYDQLHN